MNLYLVRHGQSVPNQRNLHSGWSQLPLTEQGIEDAHRAGTRIRDVTFNRVYSSDLCRAVQTAYAALPGCTPIQTPLLRERDVGCLTERYIPDCYAELGDVYVQCRAVNDFSPFGGETTDQLRARAASFLKMLEEDPCENAVAFTHEGFIAATLENILNITFDFGRLCIGNGGVLRFVYTDGRWRCILG